MQNVEIDLIDLLYRMCKKWRSMLICLIVGALVVNCGMAFKDKRSAASTQRRIDSIQTKIADYEAAVAASKTPSSSTTMSIEEYADTLKLADKNRVEAAYANYMAYENLLSTTQAYLDNSLLMKIDALHVPNAVMLYKVYSNADEMVEAYKNFLLSDSVCSKIASKLHMKIANTYIRETISIVPEADSLMSIHVVADTKEHTEAIANVLASVIELGNNSINNTYGENNVVLLNNEYFDSVDDSYARAIVEQKNSIVEILSAMNDIVASFEGRPLTYFNMLVNGDTERTINTYPTVEEVDTAALQEELASLHVKPAKLISVKNLILGAIVGVFINCCIVAVPYVLSNKLRVVRDIESAYKVSVLDTVPCGAGSSNAIDKLIDRIFKRNADPDSDKVGVLSSGIQLAANRQGVKSLYIGSTTADGKVVEIQDKLRESISGDFVVSTGASMLADPCALKTLSECEGVVLVEKINTSTYEDIAKSVNICRQNNIKVLGCAVVTE